MIEEMKKGEFKLVDAKKGLRILTLSIILNVAITVAYVFMNRFSPTDVNPDLAKFIEDYLPIIVLVIALFCYFLDFIGLHLAGKDSNRFHTAWKLKIFSLLATVGAIACAIVAAIKEEQKENMETIVVVLDVVVILVEFVIILAVIKGCLDIAPRVRKLSKFVGGAHILEMILIITAEVMLYLIDKNHIDPKSDHPLVITASVIGISFAVLALVFVVFYVLLIFRTTASVGKARRTKV